MNLKIIYEDENVLVVDKPANLIVFPETGPIDGTLIDLLLQKFPELKTVGSPPRYGIVHRLDKDTSGILLTAKNKEALIFLQKQFKQRLAEKKYLALVTGEPKPKKGAIDTLIGRDTADGRKQRAYLPFSPEAQRSGLRDAKTEYLVLKKFGNFSLVEVAPKTGRKHQIRVHLAELGHPIAGDKIYGFKNQPCPEGLKRQFLHANELKIKLPNGVVKEFISELPDDLKKIKL